MAEKDVLRPVDDAARRAARSLLRSARAAALAALAPGTGAPMASRIAVASAMDGRPVFLISRLSAHFDALEADPRASILFGDIGPGDPLAQPRMTVNGRADMLGGEARALCRDRFLARNPASALYADFADFAFWALTPERASLNGGFARAYDLRAEDLLITCDPALAEMEREAVEHMNEDHADAVQLYAERLLGEPSGPWRLDGFDPEGLDLSSGDRLARLWFDPPLAGAGELRPRLVALAREARAA